MADIDRTRREDIGQDRTGQAGQADRAAQARFGQERTGQERAGQDGMGQDREQDQSVPRQGGPGPTQSPGPIPERPATPAPGTSGTPKTAEGAAPPVAAREIRESREGREHHHGDSHGVATELVSTDTRDELTGRLRHAVSGFVDQPRASVEEADHVLEDLATRLAENLAGHRRTLRTSWEGSTEDTEKLRLALRDYRETAERLLKL
ncbi:MULTISPECIES: hypothetical protein [unclassified Streptomyces]|uniref:hypothetical protein n=1 Tax=unclassified Streptomyces TaxID=2593676 RepID=UPI00035E517B|nr:MULTISPECIES: hypothetical protein [unclassified Streptomyces]